MKLLIDIDVDESQIARLNERRNRMGQQTTTAFDLADNAVSGALNAWWVKKVQVCKPEDMPRMFKNGQWLDNAPGEGTTRNLLNSSDGVRIPNGAYTFTVAE